MESDLDELLRQGVIASIDLSLAKFILKEAFSSFTPEAFFICHLSLAVRAGHLCVRRIPLHPSIENLWKGESPLSSAQIAHIEKQVLLGADMLSQQLPLEIVFDGERVYFQKYWAKESLFLKLYLERDQQLPDPLIDPAMLSYDAKLLPEQKTAIAQVCQNSITLLSGGPGTGKTYTAGHIIRALWQALPSEKRSSFQIALAAPTGKAAAHLQMSLQSALNDLQDFKPVQAKTLHSLLSLRQNSTSISPLHCDLLLIDESSMLDINMWIHLLKSLKPSARLVLLGDPNQLPSVDSGGIFADLNAHLHKSPQRIALQTCMRTDISQILSFAEAVLKGDDSLAWKLLNEAPLQRSLSPQQIFDEIHHFIPSKDLSPVELLIFFKRYRILSPLRRGPYGSEQINAKLHQHLKPFCVPIIITQNDPKLQLYNGDTGIAIQDHAYFDGPQGIRRFSFITLPSHELAYCLSIHKSQGSEFDHVLLILPEGNPFGREALYTAATRAKQKLHLICTEETFKKTVQQQTRRLSGIPERLKAKESFKD